VLVHLVRLFLFFSTTFTYSSKQVPLAHPIRRQTRLTHSLAAPSRPPDLERSEVVQPQHSGPAAFLAKILAQPQAPLLACLVSLRAQPHSVRVELVYSTSQQRRVLDRHRVDSLVFESLTDQSNCCFDAGNTQTGGYDGVSPVTTGTSNPPYSVFTEKDSPNNSLVLQYQSISCMPQYRGSSFEVRRLFNHMSILTTSSLSGIAVLPG
jgi:hypothetical protein